MHQCNKEIDEAALNLNDLQTFLLVARAGNMAEVARTLGVPRSTIGRRIRRLEDQLGYSLLARGRSGRLTETGQLIADRCGPALRDLEDVERMLSDVGSTPTGTLKITTAYAEANTPAFGRLIATYRQRYPQVEVEVHIGGRSVDLVEEGFDLAIRPGGPRVGGPGLMRRRLGTTASGLFASPSFLASIDVPPTFEELDGRYLVVHRAIHAAARQGLAGPAFAAYGAIAATTRIDDLGVIANILQAGFGIGLLPMFMAAPLVDSGALTQLWPQREMPTMYVHLLWPESRYLAIRVRRFIDLAIEILAPNGTLVWT